MLPSNFNHLYYFYRVAVHKSVSKAAKELLIAQSALSTQLKQLEESLETTLFNRTKGGMDLTEAGDLVYEHAARMFETYDDMRRAMVLAEKQVRGPLNIACVNSVGIYVLPQILTEYYKTYPDVQIHLELHSSHRVIEMLQENQVDLALIAWSRQYPLLDSSVIMQNQMMLVSQPKHALVKKKDPRISDLVGQPFIGYEAGTPTRSMIDAHFKSLGVELEYVIEAANIATIKKLAVAGMGLAFLPEIAVESELKSKILKPIELDEAHMDRPVTVYWKEKRVLSRPAQKFLEFIRKKDEQATAGRATP
jgi:DNA-binding transcriptional LysR family regulator